MSPFYREAPLDPEQLASNPLYFADHADELLADIENAAAERVWNQIQEMHNDRCKAN